MKKLILVLCVVSLSMAVQAAISNLDSEGRPFVETMSTSPLAEWDDYSTGSVVFQSWTDPNAAVRISNSSAEGFARSTGVHNSLSETFQVTSNCTLAAAAFNVRGGVDDVNYVNHTFQIALYDMGTLATNPAAASYSIGTKRTNLLSGATFLPPTNFQGSKIMVLEFDDAVALEVGKTYALEVWHLENSPDFEGLYWVRGGGYSEVVTTAGEAYKLNGTQDGNSNSVFGYLDVNESRSQLDGRGRDFSLAIYAVPEPATIAMLGLGALALLRKRS